MSSSNQSTSSSKSILEFLHMCENLKTIKRTGWIKNNISAPESIADHMHRMAIMTMLVQDKSLDLNKCTKMAIVHDLAESIVGDITPSCGVSTSDKFKLENNAIDHLCGLLPQTDSANEIRSLWHEYEQAQTNEARLVKDIDKLEMLIQTVEYEKRTGQRLESFYQTTWQVFTHPEIKALAEEVYRERREKLGWDTTDQNKKS